MRRTLSAIVTTAGAILLGTASLAGAAVSETNGFGARGSSLGGAITASVGDPSSIYYNPAGLAAIDQPIVWLDMASYTGVGDSGNPRTGERFDFSLDAFVIRPTPILAGPLPWEGWTWGFGLLGTAGLAGRFPESNGENRFSSYSAKLLDTVIAPSVGWQVNERLSLGVTFEISAFGKFANHARFGDGYFGDALSAQTGSELSTRDGEDDAFFRLATDEDMPSGLRPNNNLWANFRSFSFVAGAQYQIAEKLRAGVVYREKSEPTYEGKAEIFLDDSVKASTGLDDISADFELEALARPRMAVGGLALGPFWGWTLHGDVQWNQWSDAERLKAEFGGEGLLGQKTLVVPLEFHDTWSLRVGLERVFESGKRFWVGYWMDKDPVPNRTFFAALLPGDLHYYSMGGFFPDLLGPGIDLALYGQLGISDNRFLDVGDSVNAGGIKNLALDEQGRLAFGPNDEPIFYRNPILYVVGLTFQYRWNDASW
jgi:long-chain fatty acid transport protein